MDPENPGNGKNPSPDVVHKFVLAARAEMPQAKDARSEGVKEKREEGIQQQIAQVLKGDEGGYGGYNKEWDDKAVAIMGMVGIQAKSSDILVMPGGAGMSSGGGNPAVALMSQDKVDQFRQIAVTKYGPGQFNGPRPNYGELLARMQIGTVLISSSLLDDDLTLKGTIWHECGHKKWNQPMEAGEVFVFEIQKLLEAFSKEKVHDWCMISPRNPEYHRTYGLAIDPGRQQLLLLLQEICTPEEFYKEFRQQYQDIMGKPLTEPASLKQSASGAQGFSGVGSTIEGTIAQLKNLMPKEDVQGARGSLNPRDAKVQQEVKFAGKRWTLLQKTNSPSGYTYKLECTSLTETDDIAPVQVSRVWRIAAQDGTKFGLTQNGPWVYTSESAAAGAMDIADKVFALAKESYPQADDQVIIQLIAQELAKDENI